MLGLKPIKLLPARERVASALRKAIISKSIPEGAELTLENTAQELGVSVTPVREAFQILARDGLLEVKQNKCAIVLGVTERTIREHYQLRAALEGTACMLCCQNNADLSKIKNCVDTAEEALSHQQAGNYTDYNQSFHFEIWEASGNEKMRNLLSELWNGASWTMPSTPRASIKRSMRRWKHGMRWPHGLKWKSTSCAAWTMR